MMYLVGFPNLLVSLHPDYVMTHLMTPRRWTAPRRVRLGVPEGGAGEAGLRSVPTPWTSGTLTNRRDWGRANRCSAG